MTLMFGDKLSHPQLAAGLASIPTDKPDVQIQSNMFIYIISIQQDVLDSKW